MSAPTGFRQVREDGYVTAHPWSARSPAIIAHNLARADLPEAITHVVVEHSDGSRVTVRRRSSPPKQERAG